jgi:rare lipoprotein A
MATRGQENEKSIGNASYYSHKFHKRKTASGIPYDKNAYTCAHRTYPFGTKLLVKNLQNGQETIVEVTDRGPFRKGRLIDLSFAAAKSLGMLRHGIASVEISKYNEVSKNIPIMEKIDSKPYLLPIDAKPLEKTLINEQN